MTAFKALRGMAGAACIAWALLAAMASGAAAAGTKICVPTAEGTAIVTATKGACAAGYTKTTLLPEAEQEKLEQILP